MKLRRSNGLHEHYLAPPPPNRAVSSYLDQIGFFQFVQIDRGAQPKRFSSTDRCFTSILYLTREDLIHSDDVMQARLDAVSKDLAKELIPRDSPNADLLSDAFGFCLREAIRNSFEHGEARFVFFLAQVYRDNVVEFALLDEGIGIARSLGKVFFDRDERELLELSLRPGISEYIGPDTQSKWQNSGFGLYVLSELAKHYGSFSLASKDWQVSLYGNQRKLNPTYVEGTALRLRLRIPEPEYFSNVREAIVQRGEIEANTLEGAIKTASKASRGLFQ
jgi:hypothetical protein